jgi:hypothetical protein
MKYLRYLLSLIACLAVVSADAAMVGTRRVLLGGGKAAAVSALWASQNWDASGSLPAGWTITPSGAAIGTAWSMSGTRSLSVPTDNNVGQYAIYNTKDPFGGNVVASTWVYFTNASSSVSNVAYVFCRGGAPASPSTGYDVHIEIGGSTRGLYLAAAGATIGSVLNAGIFSANTPYYMEVTCNGTTISARARRGTDGYWLNSSAVWVAAETTAISVTNSAITGAGYVGTAAFINTGMGPTYYDEFAAYQVPTNLAIAIQTEPSGASTVGASGGLANHRGVPILVSTVGAITSPLSVTLSDGGAGGRFVFGPTPAVPSSAFVSQFSPAAASIPANAKFGQLTAWYLPAFNRSSAVTITASSPLGSAPSLTYTPTAYATTGSPTPTGLSLDTVAMTPFNQFWTSLPLDFSGGFPALPFSTFTAFNNVGGSGATETVTAGVYSRQNTIDNTIGYRGNNVLVTGGYQVSLQVNAFGGGVTDKVTIGLAVDSNNYIALTADNHAGTVTITVVASGSTVATQAFSSLSFPAGTQFALRMGIYEGSVAGAWYKRPTDSDFYALGSTSTLGGFDFQQSSVFTTFYPFWQTAQSANTSLKVTNFTAGLPGYEASTNLAVVKDITTGAPLLSTDGNSIYVDGEVGSPMPSDGSNAVWALNTKTFVFTEVARLFLSNGTKFGAGGPITIGYNPGTSTFTVLSEDFANVLAVPYYTQTTTAILSGVHGLAMTALPYPGTAASGAGTPTEVYDCDAIFQSATYYVACMQTDTGAAHRWAEMASASTIGGTYTAIWQAANTSFADGARISQVGGTQYVFQSVGQANVFAFPFSASPQPSLGNIPNVTLDGPANNLLVDPTTTNIAHPSLAPIPGEIGGQTRYLLIGFAIYTPPSFSGIIPNYGIGVVLEALQRYTSAEFTWVQYPYLLERDLDPASNDNTPAFLAHVG